MKVKFAWCVFFGFMVLTAVISCKSAPAADEVPEATTPAGETTAPAAPTQPAVTQADLSSLEEAAARAAAARKMASDFDVPYLFPEDWEVADSLFTGAEQQKNTSTRDAVQESVARYNRASDAFAALTERSMDANYDYAEGELTAARDAAVAAGAEVLIPDFLMDADNTVLSAYDKFLAKDYYAAKEDAEEAYLMYNTLTAGLEAYKIREEIANRGFEDYSAQVIEAADNALYDAADFFAAKNYDAANASIGEALAGYSQALKAAWESYSGKARADAAAERQKALDLKANVAARDEFNAAEAVYNRANTAFQGQMLEDAGKLYDECRPMFVASGEVAQEKQRIANDALRRANERLEESDQAAKDAEAVLEGGME